MYCLHSAVLSSYKQLDCLPFTVLSSSSSYAGAILSLKIFKHVMRFFSLLKLRMFLIFKLTARTMFFYYRRNLRITYCYVFNILSMLFNFTFLQRWEWGLVIFSASVESGPSVLPID